MKWHRKTNYGMVSFINRRNHQRMFGKTLHVSKYRETGNGSWRRYTALAPEKSLEFVLQAKGTITFLKTGQVIWWQNRNYSGGQGRKVTISRSAWSPEWVQGQFGRLSEILSWNKKAKRILRYKLGARHLPSMCKTPGFIPSTTKK